MFTGIIQTKSQINIIKKTSTDLSLTIDLSSLNTSLQVGDSIAVNGVCLTIAKLDKKIATFDLMDETLQRSTFKYAQNNDWVNLEASLTLATKIDGHIVYGDVDSEATIVNIEDTGNAKIFTFEYPPIFGKYIVDKGRIAIDGAALTVIHSDQNNTFATSLIPHSLKILTIKNKKVGDKVNIEYDIFAKLLWKQRRFYE